MAVGSALGLLARVDQFFLGALPGGDVAQHGAELFAVLDAPDGKIERHQAALLDAADGFAAGLENAGRGAARNAFEIIGDGAPAFGANNSPRLNSVKSAPS